MFLKHLLIFIVSVVLLFMCYLGWVVTTIPSDFPVSKPFLVDEHQTFRAISLGLEESNYIRSALWFRALISLYKRDRHIQAGYYIFNAKSNLLQVTEKFIVGKPDLPIAQITIPEGSKEGDIARIVHEAIPTIEESDMLKAIHDRSAYGFLFPETYYLTNSITAPVLVEKMIHTFVERYQENFNLSLEETSLASNFKIRNEVSLAAILEGEAKTETDMKIVSGILQKRLAIGMPLQVDVAKETYAAKGLPNPPIANPGIIALTAAREPIKTDYLYYITGKDGTMHYAKTFTEHKENIKKYLR